MLHNIEAKVYAAAVGTGTGAIVAAFITWILGVTVWGAGFDATSATDAIAAVPGPVVGVIGLAITVGGSFLGGYAADHTTRPDLEQQPPTLDTVAGVDA